MQRYLIFDEVSKMLKGFLEVPIDIKDITTVLGVKIPIEEFPLIAEGTTLWINSSDNSWDMKVLPAIETELAESTELPPLQNPESIA